MPQATDLTVKNAAGTDKLFTLVTPAAGYGSLAVWNLKEGAISSVFPALTALARPSNRPKASGTAKHLSIRFHMPSSYVDTASGLTLVGPAWEFNGSVTVPDAFPENLKADAVAFTTNALKTALLTSMMKDATAAT
jgi:hypothetical protein